MPKCVSQLTISSILVLFSIISIITITPAFADDSEITIETVEQSGFSQECMEDGCYTPSIATVDVGGKVIMANTDTTGIHTFTSGTVDGFAQNPSDTFDSGILSSGESFEWSPDTVGEVPYYCTLHVWMVGTIIVQEVDSEEMMEETHEEEMMEETHEEEMMEETHEEEMMEETHEEEMMEETHDEEMMEETHEEEMMEETHEEEMMEETHDEEMMEETHEEEMMEETHEEEMMETKTMMVGNVDVTMSPPIEGSDDAPVTIIEFGDYQCPKCDQWFQNEKPTITKDYIDNDKAKLYFVDFPFLGDDSTNAANASYCANDQGKFWEYHSALYNNQGDINGGWANVDTLKQFGADLGLDTVEFNACVDSNKHVDRVSYNKNVGTSHGVEGTPVFIIIGSDGTTERIDGPQSSTTFAEVIDSMLGVQMEEAMAQEEINEEQTMMETETDEKPDVMESGEKEGGGCLIATAAYGSELAPQVQFLREIRDNTVMSTTSGASFMTGFNQVYYTFSPTIADMERENPMFQQAVRAFITPMVSTLSIMTLAEDGSEGQVLGLGLSVIALNLGMYVAAPALVGFTITKRLQK